MERILKKAVAVKFEDTIPVFAWGDWEKQRKTSVTTNDLRAEM
jgi:hypothetical protein